MWYRLYQVSDNVEGDPILIPNDLNNDNTSYHAKWSHVAIRAAVKKPSHYITLHINVAGFLLGAVTL
jgi:hypothetical protein